MVEIKVESTSLTNDMMNAQLAENWGWMLLRGILAIVVGALMLLMPGVAVGSLALLFSVYLLADGLVAIVAAVRAARAHERWGWLVCEGVFGIIAGVITLLLPGLTVLTFVLFIGAWGVVSGIALIIAAFRLYKKHGRFLMVLGGVLSLIWGGLLLMMPVEGALVLALWIGAYAFAFGVIMALLSIRLHRQHAKKGAGPNATLRAGA